MITIFTQNCGLINISNFNNIMYVHDNETDEHMVVLDDKYILGRYTLEEIPNIIGWIGSSISEHKVDENLCIAMPMPKSATEPTPSQEENADAEND